MLSITGTVAHINRAVRSEASEYTSIMDAINKHKILFFILILSPVSVLFCYFSIKKGSRSIYQCFVKYTKSFRYKAGHNSLK